MEEALELARAKDTKERMAGVERLHQLLEASRKSLTSSEVTSLVDCCLDLLKDNNFRVSQGALQALASAAVLSGDHLKLHFNALVPAVVERLGDGKQPVRDAARRLLLTLMEVSSPTIIVERAGSYAWVHKSWRVREEFARTVTSAIGLFASTELPLQRTILPPILQMLSDPNPGVRDAAIACIEEMYTQAGPQFRDELQRHHLPMSMLKDINARLERIEPKIRSSDGLSAVEAKPVNLNHKKSSPKAKSSSREASLFGAETDASEKSVDPIKVYSEKELIREIEKIASTLVPEKDWSIRIAAMQRIEGLVYGGAADYQCFRGLLKQLVGPLSTQLSDRRSSIVKQACHLLCFLSKELLGDFEACAEMFIPVLFKLVVITVLVIAESADNCIKTMLRNCKVARVLPRIADCAKSDRNAILRARCCDYALLILEYWADAPEIQRSADLYEDLIRCCVADAMSEVRSTARMCYRMFSKTWPERSRRLFSLFDPVIQRLINEEDGGIHRRHGSPSVRDRGVSHTPQPSAASNLPGYGTSAIVAMDRSSSLSSGNSISSGLLLSQAKSLGKGTERSLESVLHASKQKVSAIESMLRGLDLSEKHNSTLQSSSLDLDSTTSSIHKSSGRNGGLVLSDIITQIQASKDSGKSSYRSNLSAEAVPTVSSYAMRRASERTQERGSIEENNDTREARRFMNSQIDRHYDTSHRDGNFRDSHSNHVPNFQRPLLRKNVTGRMSAGRRRSFDESQLSLREMSSYVEGPASLNDALSEGLSPSSDWNARVAAFNYLRSLLQQGPRGIQEVIQNFEKVMKLFFQHLDDPHHKVAQAALSTLADIIPSCRKPFESYMERILPHVFSRLIDPKELVRQPCSTTLDIVSKTYSVDSLLPALLRSLDEQRSPKAKLAVIEFSISSFNKHSLNPEGSGNSGILKLWLSKLAPLAHEKNTKLKEAAITCIISVYSHFDSVAVLNFILSLSVEEQNSLRRALKQYTPRIEVDLMNFLQNKKERQRLKSYDPSDVVGTSSEEGYVSASKKSHFFGRYSAGSVDSDGGRKWSSTQESAMVTGPVGQAASDDTRENLYQNFETGSNTDILNSKSKDMSYTMNSVSQNLGSWTSPVDKVDGRVNLEGLSTSCLDVNGLMCLDHLGVAETIGHDSEAPTDLDPNHYTLTAVKVNSAPESGPSIPQILHLIGNGSEESPTASKRGALQQLIDASIANDHSVWTKYFNQILTVILEVLDDFESSIRELSLSLIVEMLKNQKDAMEDSVEIVIEKLLHVTKDVVPKVSNESEHCLSIVLAQYDPFRCLSVIVPLLVTEDEKTLVTCINCLTKLVGRLSQEELMAQLPSFLPALFEAFGNQSADVRKTVVFCLVDIYIMLGKAFLPYLEGLNSMQLRLVTIYANRISQARTATSIDTNHD
ncbi:CLIP-associated protein [Pyrus ussuriensis x Pyrus communis]|uniref:CLIP-associated protein n=1 Tax=Pyrus ussuriensis x Pyrus communis TaxID=2448454 RepID=A0A5N5FG13_9ROSA|nr:CLIP-associated protein [Pyrus ussuriensis x Pyrus communis]